MPSLRSDLPKDGPPVGEPERGDTSDQWPLRGVLMCAACGRRLQPLRTTDGGRAYRGPCGCRLGPADAGRIERLVGLSIARRRPDLAAVSPPRTDADVIGEAIDQVYVGADADDLLIVWRT
ncbi:zinc ribbon domain-containing protein [Solwaraspora sp. WMMD792]|uniref:zinc ribbon domain-containing protein n=1 Tax=Solwaraspora sp. WMMD792 TaxID=3016099 RepID=UPI002415A5E3|nr:zinc ribbon domain-containing protein [Solwaraspora sp. WMMD792]MDG4771992.1 zinc ribbon domain-containing protein [Solwaraspora sp. WMMD792]